MNVRSTTTRGARRGSLGAGLLAVLLLPLGCSGAKYSPPVPGAAAAPAVTAARAARRGETIRVSADAPGATPAGSTAVATGRMPIDLPTVMRLAAGQNVDVKIVRERVREAFSKKQQADWWVVPTLRPVLAYSRTDGLVQGTAGEIVDVNKESSLLGAAVLARWEIGDGIYNQLAARQRVGQSQASSIAGRNDAVTAAAVAYFDLLRGQTAKAIAQESVDLYENLEKETQAEVDAGGSFRGDVLRARARLSHARVLRQQAISAIGRSAARLRELLNLPSDIELFSSEPEPAMLELVNEVAGVDALVQQAICARPEIRAAKRASEAAQMEYKGTRLGPLYPNVTAGYTGGAFGDSLDELGDTSRLAVGLGWTVGPGGIGDAPRQRAAASRYRQAQLSIQGVKQMVVREVSAAYADAMAQHDAIVAAESGVKDAEEALKMYLERQTLGVGIPLDVVVAQETLRQARMDFVDAVVNHNKAQVRLLRAVGQAR